MTIISRTIAAAAACAALAASAHAEQFILSMPNPITDAYAPVLETLNITVVDSFEYEGAHIAVLDAPGDAWLETLFNVIGQQIHSIESLPLDWTDDAMSGIDTAARMKFGTAMDCAFCSS